MGALRVKPVKKLHSTPIQAQETTYEKARKWADQNYTLLIGAVVAILFTVVCVFGFSAHNRSKQARAQSDYGLLSSRFPSEGSAGEAGDWEKLIPDLQKFISSNDGTAAALNARIELARAFFETKRYAEAIKSGEEALKLAPAAQGIKTLIMYQLAYAYESAGKIEDASGMWTRLKQQGLPELERETDWNIGRILEEKKDFQKAAEMYKIAAQTPGEYPPAALIDQRLAGIKATDPGAARSEK